VSFEEEGDGVSGRCAGGGSREVKATLLLGALIAWGVAAWAQGPARAEVMQKAAFVKRLLDTSSTDGVTNLYARAIEHLERGEEREADARLNEALRSLQGTRRPAAATARYTALLSSVQTMRDTYARYAAATEDLHGTALAEVDETLAQARALHASAPQEALRVLALAEQSMTHALTQALGSLTVSYAPSFSGPKEEFGFEQARHRAYVALVPAAVNELKPGPAALILVQRYVDSGEALAARAAREAGQGDWRAALESVREATASVQRALGAAGLAAPEETSR
jgi:hypothetical protein